MKKHRKPVSHKTNCPSRKRRYRDKLEAMIVLNRVEARRNMGNRDRKEARIYRCPQCNGFHLTSKA